MNESKRKGISRFNPNVTHAGGTRKNVKALRRGTQKRGVKKKQVGVRRRIKIHHGPMKTPKSRRGVAGRG